MKYTLYRRAADGSLVPESQPDPLPDTTVHLTSQRLHDIERVLVDCGATAIELELGSVAERLDAAFRSGWNAGLARHYALGPEEPEDD